MSNPRAHSWYRDEAHRLRDRAAAVQNDDGLRDSYLRLAREYERLADVLGSSSADGRRRRGSGIDRLILPVTHRPGVGGWLVM